MWYAKFLLFKILFFIISRVLSHLLPRSLFANHANATKPYANVLDLLIIPCSSCSKRTTSQAFRDAPDIFLSGHLHQPFTLLEAPTTWPSTAAAPGRGSAFFTSADSTPAVAHVPEASAWGWTKDLFKSAFALAHIPQHPGGQGK